MFAFAGCAMFLLGWDMPFAGLAVVAVVARLSEQCAITAKWVATPELYVLPSLFIQHLYLIVLLVSQPTLGPAVTRLPTAYQESEPFAPHLLQTHRS
jgi:hypothetical protein